MSDRCGIIGVALGVIAILLLGLVEVRVGSLNKEIGMLEQQQNNTLESVNSLSKEVSQISDLLEGAEWKCEKWEQKNTISYIWQKTSNVIVVITIDGEEFQVPEHAEVIQNKTETKCVKAVLTKTRW